MAGKSAHRRAPDLCAKQQGSECPGEKLLARKRAIAFQQAGILAGSSCQTIRTRGGQAPSGKDMKHRILIVEDNAINSELLRDWLEVEGHEVLIAPDLNAGFAALSSQQLDAVLLDVQLGEEDGLSLASWIRQQPALREIPLIAVTAQAMLSDRQRILESGCNSIVSKPVDFALLQNELEVWLKRSGNSPERQETGKKMT